ncbi:MAG TPA: TraR/DksA C4-type zinc finger protein [Candidatus Paceibacterota bacterium]|nr:TraR/DksA C4-type zinc finger protein [Candidatus Paceibacterota bacterium]
METETITQLKGKLLEERARLESELHDLGWEEKGEWEADGGDIDHTATEEDEVADRIEEYEERSSEIDPLEAQWKNVKRALQKIEDGEYGVCEISGEEIEMDRLEANPSARTCKAHMESEGELDD